MLKIIILGIVSSGTISFFAQTELNKQSIDSGGAIAENGTVKMLFTIGEVVIAESTTAAYHVSEGFISSDINLALGIEDYAELTGLSVFPNPTIYYLNILFPNEEVYNMEIYGLNGQLMKSYTSDKQTEYQLNVNDLSDGFYLLIVKNTATQQAKVYKFLKKN